MIALFMAIGTVLLREQLLTTSAVGAVVVGFALQDTLGNLFAGLAIQIEKPFRVGHGCRWAIAKARCRRSPGAPPSCARRTGEFLIVPNSVMAKEPVLNYSEPTIANAIERRSRRQLRDAAQRREAGDPRGGGQRAAGDQVAGADGRDQGVWRLVDRLPAQFWIDDYAVEREARDQVRSNIWYTFRRHDIEIPWPIQIQYERQEDAAADRQRRRVGRGSTRGRGPVLDADPRGAAWAVGVGSRAPFAAGEAIVRQNAAATRCSWS